MATPRTPNQKKQYAKLNARLAKYGKLVERIYDKYNREAAQIAMRTDFDPDSDRMFHFKDYPQTRDAIGKLFDGYIEDISGTINTTTSEEWLQSNEVQDLLANKVLKAYGVRAKNGKVYQRYYQANSDHLKAFQTRTVNGMNLSRRVWNLQEQYKQELEMGLSVGIEKGTSAASLAKQLKQYLNEPDKLFRRVRDKYGNLELSKNAKAYHPGRGIYRSSYKNALRLTRSEANMAYRTAEQTRWKQFDFVVGYEIKLSQSHPCHDVCDELTGKYPKDFVWTGWHPQDLCYCVSILKTDDEFWRDLGNEEATGESENQVTDVPEAFKDWVRDNADRIEAAEKRGTQPYFIADNKGYVEEALKTRDGDSEGESSDNQRPRYGSAMKLGRRAAREAMEIVENIGAPMLSEEQKENIAQLATEFGVSKKEIVPMSFLDADEGKSNPFKDDVNCQSCVVAYFARRQGLDCYALPYDNNPNGAMFKLGERFQDAWINPKTGKVVEPTELRGKTDDEIISKLKRRINGNGEYVLGINRKNGEGHVISIIRNGDDIILHDEQKAKDSERYLNIDALSNIDYLEVLKVDRYILNIQVAKSVLGIF